MVFGFIFPTESWGWRELGALGGSTRFFGKNYFLLVFLSFAFASGTVSTWVSICALRRDILDLPLCLDLSHKAPH
jgi:hypothetical protein